FVGKEERNAKRMGKDEQRSLADSTTRWFRNRGYPFASTDVRVIADTVRNRADVTVMVHPGARARIREIAVSGNEGVPAPHILRPPPVEPGDRDELHSLERE